MDINLSIYLFLWFHYDTLVDYDSEQVNFYLFIYVWISIYLSIYFYDAIIDTLVDYDSEQVNIYLFIYILISIYLSIYFYDAIFSRWCFWKGDHLIFIYSTISIYLQSTFYIFTIVHVSIYNLWLFPINETLVEYISINHYLSAYVYL